MANELERSKRILITADEEINKENLKILQKYKRDMEIRELSKNTIYNYETDLMAWFRYLVKEQFNPVVTELTEDDIEEFLYFCKEEGNNTERMKRRMASISALYKFLRRKKMITENPCEFIPRPKKGRPVVVQTFLTAEQVKEMVKKLSVSVPLNDYQKRKALKEKTGFDVDAAIKHVEEEKAEGTNAVQNSPTRRVKPVVEETTTTTRRTTPKYNVMKQG